MATQCFWLEPTDTVRRWLRRYTQNHPGGWTCAEGWHEAMVFYDDTPVVWEERSDGDRVYRTVSHDGDKPPDDDVRWPLKCDNCLFDFGINEVHQFFHNLLYKRGDTGELVTTRDAPPGAMWDAWWLHGLRGMTHDGPDGRNLMVKLPNGRDWNIDGRASNCGLPDDDEHHCWIRHGEPPLLVVNKNGLTCSAGAGSILSGDYHGFLGINGAPPGWFT